MSIRYSHIVDASDDALEQAIRNGTEIKAECGHRWVPIAQGKGADAYPPCPDCHPSTRRRAVPTFVYRCYDAAERLIYVGCSVSPRTRMENHRASSWWFPQVARVRYTIFPHRDYALRMERRAIAEENPRWNVMGRWPYRSLWTAEDYADYYTAASRTASPYTPKVQQHLANVAAECEHRYGVQIEEVAA